MMLDFSEFLSNKSFSKLLIKDVQDFVTKFIFSSIIVVASCYY